MKTAIQQLKDKLEHAKNSDFVPVPDRFAFKWGLETAILHLSTMVKTEREQIEHAHNAGMAYEACEENSLPFTDYFKQTYEQ